MSLVVTKVVPARDYLEITVADVGQFTFVYEGRAGLPVMNVYLCKEGEKVAISGAMSFEMAIDEDVDVMWQPTQKWFERMETSGFTEAQMDAASELLYDLADHAPSSYLWILRDCINGTKAKLASEVAGLDRRMHAYANWPAIKDADFISTKIAGAQQFMDYVSTRCDHIQSRLGEALDLLDGWAKGSVYDRANAVSTVQAVTMALEGQAEQSLTLAR